MVGKKQIYLIISVLATAMLLGACEKSEEFVQESSEQSDPLGESLKDASFNFPTVKTATFVNTDEAPAWLETLYDGSEIQNLLVQYIQYSDGRFGYRLTFRNGVPNYDAYDLHKEVLKDKWDVTWEYRTTYVRYIDFEDSNLRGVMAAAYCGAQVACMTIQTIYK